MNNLKTWKQYMENYAEENELSDEFKNFFLIFEKKWHNLLSDYNLNDYGQLNNGTRLRPMIVYWGYLLTKPAETMFYIGDEELDYIVDFCITIETIHKVSLLVDDLIDGDTARHGKTTFHVTHGMEVTILLAINLLLKSYLFLHESLISHEISKSIYTKSMYLSLKSAFDMSLGALQEIILIKTNKSEHIDIKKIIDLETSSIIKHGFLLGYSAGNGSNDKVEEIFKEIGYCCGYIFQSLNDLEPFKNYERTIRHKGSITTDIVQNSKNVAFAYIKLLANKSEIEKINNIKKNIEKYQFLNNLIHKYEIDEIIFNEIRELNTKIHFLVDELKILVHKDLWCFHFKKFINVLISVSLERISE